MIFDREIIIVVEILEDKLSNVRSGLYLVFIVKVG